MLTVACVLKTSDQHTYAPEHVEALRQDIRKHLAHQHRFVCLTDHPGISGKVVRRLAHGWPGWWSKIELFRLPGPALCFDLDTLVVGNLMPVVAAIMGMPGEELMVLHDFYTQKVASGILGWSGDPRGIYELFRDSYAEGASWGPAGRSRWMRTADGARFLGDGEWLRALVGAGKLRVRFFQDQCPGKILSYKGHVRARGTIPDGTAVVCFHGNPKPWDPAAKMLIERCKGSAP